MGGLRGGMGGGFGIHLHKCHECMYIRNHIFQEVFLQETYLEIHNLRDLREQRRVVPHVSQTMCAKISLSSPYE